MPQPRLRPVPIVLAAAIAAVVVTACPPGAPPPPAGPAFVRRNIETFTPAQIDAYRQGVALMQSRAATDPTSWIYQANIHGVPSPNLCGTVGGAGQPAWDTCQHGNFFFLPWHRVYLYFFERILRQAVRDALDDPGYDFALPYWDYAGGAPLPEPFRDPADATNPLFVAERRGICNSGGGCVSSSQGSSTVALTRVPFCNCPGGQTCVDCVAGILPDEAFGGQFTPGTGHGDTDFGELESQPHNVVHVRVGGSLPSPGWMSLVPCAARDPIFWLHHANIDRLWQVWLNQGGRMNPLGEDHWKTQSFEFFDENGQSHTFTACEVLDMATQLDYQYEGLPVQNVQLCSGATTTAAPGGAAEEEATVMAASEPAQISLGVEPTRVAVELSDEVGQQMVAMATAEEPARLRVVVHGLKLMTPGEVFEVYLNLPEGQAPDPEGDHFLGNIAIFGMAGEEAPTGTRSFDVTDVVRKLQERGEWSGAFELTFVMAGAPEGLEARAAAAPEYIRLSHVSVVQR